MHIRVFLNNLQKPIHLLSSFNKRNMSNVSKPSVYVTRRIPPDGMKVLKPRFEICQWDRDDPVPRDELIRNVKGKDALFCLLTDRIDKEVLEAAGPSLKVVGTMSVGYDHVDLQACNQKGIPVGYTPDVLTDATAELTVALLLSASRRIIEGVDAVKTGEWGTWQPLWMCGPGLLNSTVGIVGFGRIGIAVAKRLQPFGVKNIIYNSRTAKSEIKDLAAKHVNMDILLKDSDFVIACCALNDDTKCMFNKDLFKKMKSSAIFVNTSRGGVVDQDDLYAALVSGEIRAAGIDVTSPEPLPTNHPLLGLKNCVVLPHIGSATDDTRNAMSELCARNILAVIDGQPMPAEVNIL